MTIGAHRPKILDRIDPVTVFAAGDRREVMDVNETLGSGAVRLAEVDATDGTGRAVVLATPASCFRTSCLRLTQQLTHGSFVQSVC
jgi:hypothetical protein